MPHRFHTHYQGNALPPTLLELLKEELPGLVLTVLVSLGLILTGLAL